MPFVIQAIEDKIQDILFLIFVFFGFLPTYRRKRYKTSRGEGGGGGEVELLYKDGVDAVEGEQGGQK